ncbi:MAG: hypothetical protein QOI54_1531 [Actinomycetota bacterium]|jgi:hypothetical protein|nr:hypothetical protein [Actinomycetota bacterium]
MPDSAPGRPPGRYDERGTRLPVGGVAAIVVLVGAFGVWVLWVALGAATPDVRGDLASFRVLGADRVRVSVEATAASHRPVTCTVQAEDRNREPVGVRQLKLPPGAGGTRRATAVVTTRARAVTVVLVGCRLERAGAP